MKIIALMPLRNEAWICGLTIRAALMWCDGIVCGHHACTDDTEAIIGQIWCEQSDRVFPVDLGDEPQWDEMDHRQRLLDECRAQGATHIALIDADEILTGNYDIRANLRLLRPGEVLQCIGFNLWGSIDQYRLDGEFLIQQMSVAFRDRPDLCWRDRKGYQHHHRHPFGSTVARDQHMGHGMMHLQFARLQAVREKQAHYALTECLRWPEQGVDRINRKYRWWTKSDPILSYVPKSWWEPYAQLMEYADFTDGETWHGREVQRIIEEHGREKFAGLDLFGVA